MSRAKLVSLVLLTTLSCLATLMASQAQEANKTDYKEIASKVNELVAQNFYSREIYKKNYKSAARTLLDESATIKDMQAMSFAANKALKSLDSSHCQFVTDEDEIFYFLHSLFSDMANKPSTKVPVPGFVCGGAGFAKDRVRYVLIGTTASRNDIRPGDRIVSVADKEDWTYLDIVKNGEQIMPVKVERNGKQFTLALKPKKSDMVDAYVEAMRRSIKYISRGGHTLGYIHVFTGGDKAHEALEFLVLHNMIKTDGLILDLRDGYGASDQTDLDMFYRQREHYPVMKCTDHQGNVRSINYCYDKPLVVLINQGSRSGKEILAYSLKRSKRAVLVGTNTAGYVVSGRLFPINDRCALYLAVNDITLDGERLEGKGVAPDIVVKNDEHTEAGYQNQLDVAIATLEKQLSQKASDSR